MSKSESLIRAQKKYHEKYKERLKRITITFYPTETEEWEHLQSQEPKQTYIKNLIRQDMNRA